MPLTPFQQAVSDLARGMGLRGAGEQQVYNTPQYQELFQRFNPSPIAPPTVNPNQQALESDVIMNLLTQLNARFGAGAPNLDLSGFQSQLQNITNLLSQPATLGQLSPEDMQRLGEMKASQDAQLAKQQEDLRQQLVADFFGRGLESSNLAGQAGADFAREFGLVQSDALAKQAQQELALKQFISQIQQGNLALAGQNVLGAGNLALGEFAVESDQINQMIQELSTLLGIDLGRGNLALEAQGLQERRNQFNLGLQEQSRQFNERLEASKPSILSRVLGIGASLAAAPFTGGTSLFGLAGQKLGSIFGRGTGGGSPTGERPGAGVSV